MIRATLTLLLFALLFVLPGFAQSDQVLFIGQVVDAKSGEPVPFAHVGIAAEAIGTATGYDGRFQLKVPMGMDEASFSVSCIGYTTYRTKLKNVNKGTTIRLSPSVTSLTEIVVLDDKAILNIIRRAVAAIPDNYPNAPSNSQAFYRESLTDDSLAYRYLAEGVLNVYKTSYGNSREGQVGVKQGRKINLKNPLDTVVRSGFSSGHMAAHRFDFVKNREDFIDADFFPYYQYSLDRMTTYDGKPVYVISFRPNPEAEAPKRRKRKSLVGLITGGLLAGNTVENTGEIKARLEGKVFIEKDSYAFIRAEFSVTKEGLRRYNDYPLYSGTWRGNSYTVNYRKSGERWYFSDAVRDGLRRGGALYTNEVKTTKLIEGSANQIPYLERVGREDEFVHFTGRYSEDFWRDYNVVPMSEGLAEGMRQFEIMRTSQAVFSQAYQDSLRQVRDSLAAAVLAQAEQKDLNTEAANAEESAGGQTIAEGRELDEDDPIDAFEENRSNRDGKVRWRSSLGFGAHLLSSNPPPLSIAYGGELGNPTLFAERDLDDRSFEAIVRWGFDVVFHRNAFLRYGTAFDFSKNIYRDRALGAGLQANLRPKHRPIILRAVAQYNWLRYFRKVENADVADSPTSIDGRRFRGDEIRLSYGTQQQGLALSAELSVEETRGRELFVRATYHHALQQRQGVWFKETGQIFRKDEYVPVHADELTVSSNDTPFADPLLPEGTWSVTVGWVFD